MFDKPTTWFFPELLRKQTVSATIEPYTAEIIAATIDESYVAPNEMARLVNYTGIQTGFEITMTPMMWAGVAMIAAARVLAVFYGKSGKKGGVKKRRR